MNWGDIFCWIFLSWVLGFVLSILFFLPMKYLGQAFLKSLYRKIIAHRIKKIAQESEGFDFLWRVQSYDPILIYSINRIPIEEREHAIEYVRNRIRNNG